MFPSKRFINSIIPIIILKNFKKEEKCDERKRGAGELQLTYKLPLNIVAFLPRISIKIHDFCTQHISYVKC